MAVPKNRAKSDAIPFLVPQTRQDVDAAIARIGAMQRERTRMHADKDERLAIINQEIKARMEPLEVEIRQLQTGIQTWCESRRTELTNNGKVKFHDFAAGQIKWRTRPPKVVLRAVDMVIDMLKSKGLGRFVRIKEEVNKEAILADQEAIQGIAGIKIEQGEDFVVEPFETRIEEVM